MKKIILIALLVVFVLAQVVSAQTVIYENDGTDLESFVSYSNLATAVSTNPQYVGTDAIDETVIIKSTTEVGDMILDVDGGTKVTVRVISTTNFHPDYTFMFSANNSTWTAIPAEDVEFEFLLWIYGGIEGEPATGRAARLVELEIPAGMKYFRIMIGGSAAGFNYRISEIKVYGESSSSTPTASPTSSNNSTPVPTQSGSGSNNETAPGDTGFLALALMTGLSGLAIFKKRRNK